MYELSFYAMLCTLEILKRMFAMISTFENVVALLQDQCKQLQSDVVTLLERISRV